MAVDQKNDNFQWLMTTNDTLNTNEVVKQCSFITMPLFKIGKQGQENKDTVED